MKQCSGRITAKKARSRDVAAVTNYTQEKGRMVRGCRDTDCWWGKQSASEEEGETVPGKLMTGSWCVMRTISLTSSGHHGRTLVEKLLDYSVHRILMQEPRNTVNYNAISEA